VFKEPHIGGNGRPCHGLSTDDLDKLQFFDPSSTAPSGILLTPDNDTIGFFVAKFKKAS